MVQLTLAKVGLIQTVLTLATIFHAWKLNGQFFPTCVYLLRSNLSMLILVTFGIYLMVLATNAIRLILFGKLRPIEVDHLHEYGWMTVSESFLAMTIFRNEFDSKFAFVFAGLILCKGLHWITRDRVDYMEQAIRLPDRFHVSMVTALYILALTDFLGAALAMSDVIMRGPSMSILVANECSLMFVSVLSSLSRYLLNLNDIRRGAPWDRRSAFLFYLDFAFDLSKLTIYTIYFAVIVAFYGLPIHIIRELYVTFRSFLIRINDIIRYRKATADMENKYPTVTADELAAAPDKVCIICREEMEFGHDGPKKLPCGHFFHLRCLRSWLERQQTCPTCRKSVMQTSSGPVNDPIAAQYPGNMAPREEARPRTPTPTESIRLTENNPVIYVSPDNISTTDDGTGRYVLKDSLNSPNPIYLERVHVSSSHESSSSDLSSQSPTFRVLELDRVQDQLRALKNLRSRIDSLIGEAEIICEIIEKKLEKEPVRE